MNKIIKIYDNLFPKNLEDQILDFSLNSRLPMYSYQNNISGPDKTKETPGISHTFWGTDNHITEHCGFLLQPLYIFCHLKNIMLHEVMTSRLFLTFPLKDININYIHNDQQFPHFVCLYYINNSDGDTIFYNNQKEEIQRVSPKKGRIIFFDGTIKHSGSFPSKNTRAIINYNFSGEFFNGER
jgi:hypothetical protein